MGKDKKKTAAAEAAATAALASSRAAVDAMRAAHAARIAVEDLKKEQRRTLRIELRKKAHFLLSVLVILVYYGAGYLYYSDAEGWDLVDSVYFAVVTCTTIGYGDLVPTSEESKVFTILFGALGVGMVMVAIQEVGAWMAIQKEKATAAAMKAMLNKTMQAAERNKSAKYKKKEVEEKWQRRREAAKAGVVTTARFCSRGFILIHHVICQTRACLRRADAWLVLKCGEYWVKPRTVTGIVIGIIWPILAYLFLGASLCVFEGWTVAEGIYFSAVTVLTIGYGDLKPTTKSGKIFCIFYIPMALGVLLSTFDRIREFRIQFSARKVSLKTLLLMDEDFDGKVTEAEHLRAHLRAIGFSSTALDAIQKQFRVLDRNSRGFLDLKDIEMAGDVELEVRGEHAQAVAELEGPTDMGVAQGGGGGDTGTVANPAGSAAKIGVKVVV